MSATISSTRASSGYDPAFFATLDRVEDRHFWFRARRRAVAAVLDRITQGLAPGYRVLELGCGNGGMLKLLQDCSPGGKVVGMDLFSEGLRNARHRCNCPLVQGDVTVAPFREVFQIVGMFDVLEHVDADVRMLADVYRLLAPGGHLLITVPAHMSLWSYFDVAAHHARRYDEPGLARKLRATGFEVSYLSPFMGPIFPLVWLGRRLKPYLRKSQSMTDIAKDDLKITPGLNGLLGIALSGEAGMIKNGRKLTLGTSLLAVARRPVE